MIESVIVYAGLILAVAGVALVVRPFRWLRVTTRSRGLVVAGAGIVLVAMGLFHSSDVAARHRAARGEPEWILRDVQTGLQQARVGQPGTGCSGRRTAPAEPTAAPRVEPEPGTGASCGRPLIFPVTELLVRFVAAKGPLSASVWPTRR